MSVGYTRDRVVGISPLERPDVGLVMAVHAAGALGVLDVGRDPVATRSRLALVDAVRIPEGVELALPPNITTVIVGEPGMVARYLPRRVLAQVVSVGEALAAIAAGASGVIAKGMEAGGRVGDETTFVLVQRLVTLGVPVWAQGGIGEHTAAACIAGGAAGVVIDSQLALVRESSLPAPVRAAIAAMDGSETTVLFGHRVFTRPDLVATRQVQSRAELVARLGGDDLATNVLPLGQDAALAEATTAGGLVRGLTAAITRDLALAVEHEPLAPGSPFARAHGLRYPIAQGPMSRVSDRAKFAAAVAHAGGLPFLALTLLSGPDVRELLLETKALVGDRPWGVGILGFVPPEIRERQLEVIREVVPPIAVIAGGRPSQAAPLEAQGTATYLHVPSPGLLDLFLKDGARRFVFEGSECGGHTGPRTSFVLWQQQIARILASEHAGACDVLFAGGIHDARSAAMIATMAAPLAARGARVGVVMGTAYLFTHEAVACGAIEPGFQRAALACDRTVLLETSPGHSTRCAATPYVAMFEAEKQRLAAAGVGAKEAWAQLEQLNLGRLRIAAKGLRREGDVIEDVDAATQEREGMYMIGQVAALRGETLSIAALHEDVSVGGTALLGERAVPRETSGPTDVAIVGLAAIFPGAPDTDAFWANIVAGRNAIREVPADRWDIATYYDPNAVGAEAGKKTPSKWGGFIDDVPFDPLAYGIPPKSLQAIEPVQLLALEIAKRALVDAGYAAGGEGRAFDRSRTSVIFGAEAGTDLSSAYSFRAMFPHYVGPLPAALETALPTLSEDSFPGVLSNVIAGRIANRLDLGGVNFTVDAACAASLAALDMAVKELAAGSSDMVLCGGADLHNSINDYLMFSSVHALSPTGQCHTFDAHADGIVLGEGVACVVLKRLADAERDGDRVYAVVKAVAGASDGKSLGLTAPRKEGQVRALERAYARAGVSPAAVGLVEAHGTGTVVGDRTELATLTDVYTAAGAAAGSCALGSVKSQIGHTKCAAGMAGLIKAALSIHHGVLPPTSNVKAPNPAWQREASPFVFHDRARPWLAAERVAAVSAFGFGGTNFHAVLAQHRRETHAGHAWPAELVIVRDVDALGHALDSGARLRDLARTSARGRGPVVATIVADNVEDLRAKLAHVAAGTPAKDVWRATTGEERGKIAFLCPGQGSQKAGMLAELFVAFPRLHRLLELGAPWAATMLPPAAFDAADRAAQAEAITDTRVAQPALGIADLAVAELLAACGVTPDMLAGHSYGELAALAIAGAIGPAELLELSAARGAAILAAAGGEPGTMAAVAADGDVVASLIEGTGAVVANFNSPRQCVISGSRDAVAASLERCAAAKLGAKKIAVACAFHSPIVAGAQRALAGKLAGLAVHAPRVPVWSNTTAAPYPSSPDEVRARLAAQVAQPVRFAAELRAMYDAGARVFVEVGPGQVLTKLVGDTLGDLPHVAIACDAGDASLTQFLRALAVLAAHGVGVDVEPLFQHRDATIVDLAAPAAPPKPWLVSGHRTRSAKEPRMPQSPIGLAAVAPGLVAAAPPAAVPAIAGEREGVVLEYLRTMRSMITAQRDVLLSYLGAVPAPMTEWASPVVDVRPQIAGLPAVVAVPAVPVPVPVAMVPVPAPVTLDPMQLVVSIVSERTGYPTETLGIDLDLEADLSIDSIKRIEIIGELAQRLGLRIDGDHGADALVEELATKKTLRGLVGWLVERLDLKKPGPTGPSEVEQLVTEPAKLTEIVVGGDPKSAQLAAAVQRYRLGVIEAPAPPNGHTSFAGKKLAIYDGGPIGEALATRLRAEGAVVIHGIPEEPIDGFIDLGVVDGVETMRGMFERVRAVALGGVKLIYVATTNGELGRGGHGGPAGLIKTVAAEWPDVRARVVDLDAIDDATRAGGAGHAIEDAAAKLYRELQADDHHVEIGYVGGVRSSIEVIPAEVPIGDVDLDRDSVVLVTGGARGITAKVAIALVERHGCRIVLCGRSDRPGPEDPELVGARDAKQLRGVLAKLGGTPAIIEARVARVLADREIRATLAALGAHAEYHAVDVRRPELGALIDELYARYGRIDAVIHGAGVLEDKLIRHKTPESFERVFATKLTGAQTLVDRLRDDVKLVVLFSSISGAFGNRGQVDYAAAGDALDKLAWRLQRKISGRVVSIDWGPWAGTGMVSAELEREYAKRQIRLIDPVHGVEALLAELRAPRGEAQVIWTASDPRGR